MDVTAPTSVFNCKEWVGWRTGTIGYADKRKPNYNEIGFHL
jgi:hypothetical protein